VEGTTVQVGTVFVDDTEDDLDDVKAVDFSVGVTVADGFVNAAVLPSLSTKGLMGTVADVAAAPAFCGNGSGRLNCCCWCLSSSLCTEGAKGELCESSVLGFPTGDTPVGVTLVGVTGKKPGISLDPPRGDIEGVVGVLAAPGDLAWWCWWP